MIIILPQNMDTPRHAEVSVSSMHMLYVEPVVVTTHMLYSSLPIVFS